MIEKLPRLRALEILRLPGEEGTSYLLRDPEGYASEDLVLSEAGLFVAAHLDGGSTIEDLSKNFEQRYGTIPDADQVQVLVSRLGEAFLLENDAFFSRRETLYASFLSSPTRAAAHAGVSYPSDPAEAARTFDEFWEASATLEEPGEKPQGHLRGIIAPHIDLRVGGPCTALAYRLLNDAPNVETVVVLGTSHACPHPSWIVAEKPFETPLGSVPVNHEISSRLADAAGAPGNDLYFHRKEHSVEFQAYFLAGLRARGRAISFVPVLCGSLRTAESSDLCTPENTPFLAALREILTTSDGRVVVVAGADLAHVGPRFGEPDPLSAEHLRFLETKDRETLERVASGDALGFHDSVLEQGDPRRICGLSPIYALLSVLPGAKGKILRYEQATDPTGTVSYASAGLFGDSA